jgi:hypothetical protein
VQAFGYGQTVELLEAPGVIDQRQEVLGSAREQAEAGGLD